MFHIKFVLWFLFPLINEIKSNEIDQFILAYYKKYNIFDIVYVGCRVRDISFWAKKLSSNGCRFVAKTSSNDFNSFLLSEHHKLGVIVDLRCLPLLDALLRQAEDHPEWFNDLHHWIFTPDDEFHSMPMHSRLMDVLRLDSHVTLLGHRSNDVISIRDIIRIGPNLLTNPKKKQRDDFLKHTLESGWVFLEEPWDKTAKQRIRGLSINSVNEMGLALLHLMSEIYNFKMDMIPMSQYGYVKINGTFDGLLGLFQKKQIEIGTGMLIKDWRLPYLHNCGPYKLYCPRFIFRRPPISATNNIYALAFSTQVWTALLVMTFLSAITLTITEYLGYKGHKFEDLDGWFDYSFAAIGVMALQGVETSPKKISSRVVFFFLLILAVFFDTCYSAAIVVLLQSPNKSIKTLRDLFFSPYKIIMQATQYNRRYINYTTDPWIKRLYYEKIFTLPDKKVFVGIEEGLKAVLTGDYAFHTHVEAYKTIMETWTESDKCTIQELAMYPCMQTHIPTVQGSQYQNHIRRAMLLLNEVGLTNREDKIWFPKAVQCTDESQEFVSVSLQDFRPAIVLFLIGYTVALVVFFSEILFSRISKNANF